MQVSETNPMTGIDGRANLLVNLAQALISNPIYFGADARPGNLVGKSSTLCGGGKVINLPLGVQIGRAHV